MSLHIRVKISIAILMLLALTFNVSAQTPPVQGENCYSRVFEEKVIGHSLANTYLLMYAAYNTYENRMGVANFNEFQKKFKEIFTPLGISRFDFINKKEKTADTQAVVMSNDKLVIVSFRGSESSTNNKVSPVKIVYDWVLTDFNFFKKRVPWWGWGVKVHSGFYNALDIVYDDLKSLVDRHMAGVPKRLWITGHSLGAGVAPLAAYRLAGDGLDVQGVYTFAGPRIGNDNFAKAIKKRFPDMQRWVLDNDIVTKVPFKIMKFKHIVAPNNIYGDGKFAIADGEMKGPGKVKNHMPGMYLQKIYDLLPLELKDKMPPPPAFGSDRSVEDAELERAFNGDAVKAEEDTSN
ncbi:MAG TPA: lipase family protein [Candidatus Ozemobacteraceae bacterium]|nr:lipase family protein [Candidatus Ozemobacteraceae bacterium]